MIYWGPVAAVGTAVGMLGYAWMAIPYIGGWMVLGIGCVGSVLFRRSLFLYVTVTILAMAIGMLRMGQVGDAYGKEWENRFGKPLQVMGTILEKRASYIDERGSMVTYIMQAEKVGIGREVPYASGNGGNIYVTLPASPRIGIGSTVQVAGVLRPLTYTMNPGTYDRFHKDRERNIVGRLRVKKIADMQLLQNGKGRRYYVQRVRETLYHRFCRVLPTEKARILSSLLFGGHYDELPPALIRQFAATGLIHILSVSGSHMALLFAALQVIGRRLGWPQRVRFIFLVGIVCTYGALSEFAAPVVRSLIMGLISAYGVVLKRRYMGCQALGIAIAGMLLYNPFMVFDLSFRLSCGASAGILLWYSKFQFILQRFPSFLRESLALCASAQILVMPLVLASFQALPVYSFIANLLVAPVLDLVILLGLGSVITGSIWTPLGDIFLYPLQWLLTWAIQGNACLAAFPYSRYWHGALSVTTAAAWYIAAGAVFLKKRQGYIAAGLSSVVWVSGQMVAWLTAPAITVYSFDFGRDSAVCAVTADNRVRLWYNKENFSSGEDISYTVIPALQYEGIFALDACTVSGKDTKNTARQLAPYLTAGKVRQCFGRPPGCTVFSGRQPYYLSWGWKEDRFPAGACVEVFKADKTEFFTMPEGVCAWIVHCPYKGREACAAWKQAAAYKGVYCFAPATDGRVRMTYVRNRWLWETYKGARE